MKTVIVLEKLRKEVNKSTAKIAYDNANRDENCIGLTSWKDLTDGWILQSDVPNRLIVL